MSLKFKALGLGLIATMVMSAFAAMNATAGTGGHFHASKNGQDVKHPTIKVTEEGTHAVHLKIHGAEGEVGCTEANYTTTLLNATENDITVSPEYKGCTTTNTPTNVTIDMNGCGYTFKVAAGTTGATEQTADLECPAGKSVVVTHPNCTSTIAPQANVGGITYTTDITDETHIITLDVKADFQVTFHGGICVFLGTNKTGTLEGSATVEAFNTNTEKVDLTAT